MKVIYLVFCLPFICLNIASMDLRRDSEYGLSTTRVVNLNSINVVPSVSVDEALLDLFEPHSSRKNSSNFSFVDQFCQQYDVRQGTVLHTALQRHCSQESVKKSPEDLKEILFGVLEKSELLVQQQTQAMQNKEQELVRQTTLFQEEQDKANKDKKKWACGGAAATVIALLAPFAPLIATAYTSIAGQCAEQCAELCSS